MSARLRGRDAELGQITRMLHAVATGASAVLHVEGGWGSGRTRLLQEAADAAARLRFTVLDGGWIPGTEPAALGTCAAQGPVLVVLDDLHLADPAFVRSLRMLPWHLRDQRIGWILSRRRRAGGPAVDLVFSRPHPAGGHVDLQPLPAQAVGLLMADQSAGAVPELSAVLRATGGNPLLAVGLAGSMSTVDRPPHRIRASVERCLQELGDDCRRLLQVGGVLGVHFTLHDVTKLLHRPTAELLAPVEEAIAADILLCDGDRLAFSQELFWRCALASLPCPARTALEQEAAVERLTVATPDRGEVRRDAEPVRRPTRPILLARPTPSMSGWVNLGEIERTVAHLVSQGLTNQQIASRLHRSPHTINYHLRRIFQKLGIRSRIDLARLALLHYSTGPESAADMDAAG